MGVLQLILETFPSKCIGKEGAPAVTSTVIFFMQ